jgi:hypothetical protein
MKFYTLFFYFAMLLFLTGCDDVEDEDLTPITYDYEYPVTTDNYETFLAFDFVDTSTSTDNQVKITFTLKEPSKAVNIKIDYQIETRSDILEPTTTLHDHMTNVYGSKSHVIEIEYPALSSLIDVKIVNVSGKIQTNTYHDLEDHAFEENLRVKADMIEWLTPLVDHTDQLTMSMMVEVDQDGWIERTHAVTIAREEPFYYAVEVDHSLGFVIERQGDALVMIELGIFEGVSYYRVLDEVLEEDLEFSLDFGLDQFDDTWHYAYENDAYVVTARAREILSVFADDDPLLSELMPYVTNDPLTLTIELNEANHIMLTTRIVTDVTTTTVTTTYDYTKFEPIEYLTRTEMPLQNPLLINDYTDLTERTTSHLFESQMPNYYLTSFEEGTYALEVDSLLDVTLYDEDGVVELVPSPHYAFQTEHQNIYDIPAGDYLVEVTSRHDVTLLYTLEFVNLSKQYDTLPDIDHPDRVVANTYEVIIEGKYDYAFLAYDSPDGGVLKLTGFQPYSGELYIMDRDGLFNHLGYAMVDDVLYIPLRPGENLFYFKHTEPLSLGFDVTQYGHAPDNLVLLTDQYPDDFLVPYDDHLIRYQLNVPDESIYTFAVRYDVFMNIPSNGRTVQVKRTNDDGGQTDYTSFSIFDQREIYLPPGEYELIVLGSTMTSLKMKATQTPVETEPVVEITLDSIDDLQTYDLNPEPYYETYRTLPGYEKTIVFTLSEPASILVDRAHDISPYGLYDENEHNFTYKHLYYERIYHLDEGTYEIRLGQNDQTSIRNQEISVLIVTDQRVLEDDATYPYQIALDQGYTFTKDHELDFEVLQLTIEETMDLTLNVSDSLFLSIYDETGSLVKQTYDGQTMMTLGPGTYDFTVFYTGYSPIGRSIDFEITETAS